MIIDRFESEFAVIELASGEKVIMPKILLPIDAKEGDSICITIDSEKTIGRKNRLQNKMSSLFKD